VSGLLREEGIALAVMHVFALAALCHGDEAPLRLVERRLLFDERIGTVDPAVPQMPLAADLERWQKRSRLKPEDLEREIALDLRSEAGLLKSTLLHRLTLIEVDWGKLRDAEAGRGTFRETWLLAWSPILSVKLAEGQSSDDVAALARLVKACLLADLPRAAEACIARLQAAAVDSGDIAG
jgi:hypothetical protein